MRNALFAAIAYFAATFALGFVLGAVRTLALEPRIGALPAVSIELPIILLSAWFICGWSLRRFSVDTDLVHRLLVCVSAFALLMAAEISLSIFGFSRTLDEIFADWRTAPGALGFAGQIVFALFPLVRHRA